MDSTLVSVIIGGLIATLGSFVMTKANLDAARRQSRLDYLNSRMSKLAECIAAYEVWLAKQPSYRSPEALGSEVAQEHARIIGEAIAVCLSVSDMPENSDLDVKDADKPDKWRELPDVDYKSKKTYKIHRLAFIANERLTRNFVTTPEEAAGGQSEINKWGHYHDRNRAALNHAAKRLAQLIHKT